MAAITPASFEKIAQSYAALIKAGEKTIADVPARPEKIYNRVVELIAEEQTEEQTEQEA